MPAQHQFTKKYQRQSWSESVSVSLSVFAFRGLKIKTDTDSDTDPDDLWDNFLVLWEKRGAEYEELPLTFFECGEIFA
jgi:hypothetical protein